jgi:arsenite methyltransferase
VGIDAQNFRGVRNPHIFANISDGDVVLDLGCGSGVESFIAADRVGPSGKVYSIDPSQTYLDFVN